jgi:hypothetical protein
MPNRSRTCLVLAAGGRVAPGAGIEPPAADGVQEPGQIAAGACLLERGVEVSVLAAEGIRVGAGGQDGPDRGQGARRA